MRKIHLWLTLLVGIMLVTGIPLKATAQTTVAKIQITDINAEEFPDVVVQAILRNGNDEPVPISDLGDVQLLEDGNLVTDPTQFNYQYKQVDSGIEIVFVLDIGTGVTSNDSVTGQSRLAEMQNIVETFINEATELDRIGIVLVRGSEASVPVPLTSDFTKAKVDMVTALDRIATNPPTPQEYSRGLVGITKGIQELSSSPSYGKMVQTIIFLSSGVQEGITMQSVVEEQAKVAGIPLQTILTRKSEKVENLDYAFPLQTLAENTGGLYKHYIGESALGSLRAWLTAQRVQYLFQFRSSSNVNSQRTLQIRFAGNDDISDTEIYQVTILPPVVVIDTPANNDVLNRVGNYGQNPDTVEPSTLEVGAHIDWPDGYPRAILEAQLLVNGEPTGQPIPFPGETFNLSIDLKPYKLGTTDLKLQIQVQDELQFDSFSTGTDIQVSYIELPAPTPSPAPPPETIIREIGVCDQKAGIDAFFCKFGSYAGWVGLGLGGVALVMVVVFRRPLAKAGGAVIQSVRETITRLTRPAQTEIGAYLEILRGDDQLKEQKIPLYAHTVTPLGRSPEEAEIVFHADNDRSVISRLHCEISDEDGIFRIRDLGSSHGTYVNGIRLTEGGGGQPLHNGDRIELGQAARGGVMLKFHVADGLGTADENIYETSPTPYEEN